MSGELFARMNEDTILAVCQECDTQSISGYSRVLWDKATSRWVREADEAKYMTCHICEGECIVDYITEEELKVRQVEKRMKGVSV